MALFRRNALLVAVLAMAPACGVFVGITELEVEPVVDGGAALPPDAGVPPVFEASVPETYVPPEIDAGCKILSTGPLEPKNIAQNDSEGGPNWDRLDDGKTADDKTTASSAQLGPPAAEISRTIRFTGYSVAVPPTARVFGVKAEIRARAAQKDFFADKSVMLTFGGENFGADLARKDNWTTSFESRVYGGETNPWGIGALTPAIVTLFDFGIAFKVQRVPTPFIGFPTFAFGIDVIRVTVFYCE